MAEKQYAPTKLGVAQWLKDNPTKTNARGRKVPTGLSDAYKAVNYPPSAPRLKSKAGNLTDNRSALRFEARGDNGDTARAAATKHVTEAEFVEWGKRNGKSVQEGQSVYARFIAKNKGQDNSVPKGLANDHFNPNSARVYQSGENWRNRHALSPKVNGFKSNKMPTAKELRTLRIPTSTPELIRKEFANEPGPDPAAVRRAASQIARDPTRLRATTANKMLDAAKLRRSLMINSKGLGGGALAILPDIVNIINNATNQSIDKGINKFVNRLKLGTKQTVKAAMEMLTNQQSLGYDLDLTGFNN